MTECGGEGNHDEISSHRLARGNLCDKSELKEPTNSTQTEFVVQCCSGDGLLDLCLKPL